MQKKQEVLFLTENNLKTDIKSKNFKPIYILFGDEHYMIKRYVKNIVESAISDFTEFNVSRFDGSVKIQEVYDAVSAFPMMSPKRAVTLCDFSVDKASQSELDKLISLISDVPATTVFVIWFETVEINTKKLGEKFSKLFRATQQVGGAVFNIARKTTTEIIKLMQTGAAKRQCRMDASAARYMTEMCSDDLNTLINELEKLCAYVGEGGVITVKEINEICSRSTEASVYNVSKAVLRGDLKEAYSILDDLFYMNTEPAFILSCLASAYVDIYRAYSIRASGERVDSVAKELGYYNTAFRLTEAQRHLSKLNEQQIVRSLKCLADCDQKVKSSRCSGRVTLEKAVAQLAVIARTKG